MIFCRSLVQKPLSFFLKNKEKLFTHHNLKYSVDEDESWKFAGEENIYKGVFNLVNHIEKLSLDKELSTMIKSAVLLRFLICNGYFEREDSNLKSATENQIFIGKLLYIFQLGMNHNQHGVYNFHLVNFLVFS